MQVTRAVVKARNSLSPILLLMCWIILLTNWYG